MKTKNKIKIVSHSIILLLLTGSLYSCGKDDIDKTDSMEQQTFIGKDDIDKTDSMEQQTFIGCWTHPVHTYHADGKRFVLYERANTLSADSESIEFLENGSLIERKNAGFCGTPPVSYANYSGNWHVQNGNIIIDVAYWGGMEHRNCIVIEITGTALQMEVVNLIRY